MPAVELQFVTISHPDDIKKRNTRRTISQHVMKEIGMARRHKGKKGVRSKKPSPGAPPRNIPDGIDKTVATHTGRPRDPEPAPRRRSEDGFDKSIAPYGDQSNDPFNLSPRAILSRPFSARAELLRTYRTVDTLTSPAALRRRSMY
ncbi:hypothetical protein ACRE_035030 [Hapsidospora chrysogenum ATCC 11550]|uniref:Uncharacterized protein n=1 Tax=Hapsidospora chrysogenum (strain ATCC 11550 / CBS 779.69 / DSM 880 / IAM 14645 / JCM 23072 / IMI 49137) TaxID=857340 RepID=A0A086T8F8_HAPC1|nr:hypothetical protein ACRE_035030 [Hapsidospora chrysogenum ATCC 11550]